MSWNPSIEPQCPTGAAAELVETEIAPRARPEWFRGAPRAAFEHAPKATLPMIEAEGKQVRVILGSHDGATAPLRAFTKMVYADADPEAGASLPPPDGHEDRGAYILSGAVEVAGTRFEAGRMPMFRPGDRISLWALDLARVMPLGGATMEGPRYIWGNFVASSREKIEAAKKARREGDWAHGRVSPPPDDDEFIPAPER